MKNRKTKSIIAWMVLVLLIAMLLGLNYVKFFAAPNENIEERPAENSSDQAINMALEQIVENFNKSTKLTSYQEQGITMKAIVNNHSIFISYITDTKTTYEFSYNNLSLDIKVENTEENLEKFHIVYDILIRAVQQRIGNIEDIDPYLISFFDDSEDYEGLYKEAREDILIYHMDITKKLKGNQTIDNQITNEDTTNMDNE